MSEEPSAARPLRIGEVAQRAETTQRTVRYYEEIGLLPGSQQRRHGGYRTYSEADVERLRHILRLKHLLGVSLDELKDLIEAEDARAALREQFRRTHDDPQRRGILREALEHLDRQLQLVRRRQEDLNKLHGELKERREYLEGRLTELQGNRSKSS